MDLSAFLNECAIRIPAGEQSSADQPSKSTWEQQAWFAFCLRAAISLDFSDEFRKRFFTTSQFEWIAPALARYGFGEGFLRGVFELKSVLTARESDAGLYFLDYCMTGILLTEEEVLVLSAAANMPATQEGLIVALQPTLLQVIWALRDHCSFDVEAFLSDTPAGGLIRTASKKKRPGRPRSPVTRAIYQLVVETNGALRGCDLRKRLEAGEVIEVQLQDGALATFKMEKTSSKVQVSCGKESKKVSLRTIENKAYELIPAHGS